MYDIDGSLRGLIDPATIQSTGITDSGEVTYVKSDALLGSDVFSTERGQLTFSGTVSTHSANGAGEFIYTELQPGKRWWSLLSDSGELLWDGMAGWPDLNDYGDIVFNVPTFYEVNGVRYGNFALVLLTSRPKFYQSRFHGRHTLRPAPRLGAPICVSGW